LGGDRDVELGMFKTPERVLLDIVGAPETGLIEDEDICGNEAFKEASLDLTGSDD
jgi:hypothetical protein